jgi:hypothetical protein
MTAANRSRKRQSTPAARGRGATTFGGAAIPRIARAIGRAALLIACHRVSFITVEKLNTTLT